MYDVAVILINYNSSIYTINCIQSIQYHTNIDIQYTIIVVDNNSEHNDLKAIEEFCMGENITLVKSNVNTGFGGGNMLGYNLVKAKYYFFLNNDCMLLNDNLYKLYQFMENTDDAAMCIGQMFNSEEQFHTSFNYTPHIINKFFGNTVARLIHPNHYPKKQIYYSPIEVPQIYGAAMFIRGKYFEQIKGFDNNIFLYAEEEDIALGLRKLGYKFYLIPEAKFIHHVGKSSSRNLQFEKEFYLSTLYVLRKHYSILHFKALQFVYLYKVFRRGFKNNGYWHIFWFILKGASIKESLKYKAN